MLDAMSMFTFGSSMINGSSVVLKDSASTGCIAFNGFYSGNLPARACKKFSHIVHSCVCYVICVH